MMINALPLSLHLAGTWTHPSGTLALRAIRRRTQYTDFGPCEAAGHLFEVKLQGLTTAGGIR